MPRWAWSLLLIKEHNLLHCVVLCYIAFILTKSILIFCCVSFPASSLNALSEHISGKLGQHRKELGRNVNNSSRGIHTALFIFRENFLTITKRKSTSEHLRYADVITLTNFKKWNQLLFEYQLKVWRVKENFSEITAWAT